MTKDDEILTPTEAAEYLKVSMPTIYRLVTSKQLPAFKVKGSLRFKAMEIQRYIENNQI